MEPPRRTGRQRWILLGMVIGALAAAARGHWDLGLGLGTAGLLYELDVSGRLGGAARRLMPALYLVPVLIGSVFRSWQLSLGTPGNSFSLRDALFPLIPMALVLLLRSVIRSVHPEMFTNREAG